jgi:hypothetical protein
MNGEQRLGGHSPPSGPAVSGVTEAPKRPADRV